MATYELTGYSLSSFTMPAGNQFRIDPDWDAETDRRVFTITDDDTAFEGDASQGEIGDDASQTAVVRDAQGNTLGNGQVYLEEAYVLTDEFGGTVRLYKVEIGGTDHGYIASSPLQPGNTYTITAVESVSSASAPSYSSFASASYDQNADNAITGTQEADTLSAGAGDDTVDAGAGSDTIDGGAGDDSLDGGAGDDTITGGAGDDTIFSGTGGSGLTWTDVGDGANVQGTSGQDFFRWSGAANSSGVIRLNNSPGAAEGDGVADYIQIATTNSFGTLTIGDFEVGTDKIVLQQTWTGSSVSSYSSNGLTHTDVQLQYSGGTSQSYRIYHTGAFSLNQVFTTQMPSAQSDNDHLSGGADADTFLIEDGFGSDTVDGGETTTIGEDYDTLDLSQLSGPVTVTFTGTGAGTLTDGTDTLTFSGIERIVGTEQDDVIDASADDTGIDIFGGDGDDSISGGDGADLIDGGAGADTIMTGAGDDTVYGRGGDDVIDDMSGTRFDGERVIDAGTGSDTVWSGEGANTVTGGAGSDVLQGEGGDDLLHGDAAPGGLADAGGKFAYEFYELDGSVPETLADAGFDGSENVSPPDGQGSVDTTDVGRIDGGHDGDGDTFAVKLTTTLTVTTAGTYSFDLSADDGAKLFIDGVEVIDHDGAHAYSTESASLGLGSGEHTIEIIYFERTGGEALDVAISGPDTGGAPVALENAAVGQSYDDTISGGAGDDTIHGGAGDDAMDGGDDADTFVLADGFGSDTITGGEGGNDADTIDLSGLTGPVTVTYSGDEAGTITDGTDTLTFSEIETLILTDRDDSVDATVVGDGESGGSPGVDIEARGGDDTVLGGAGNDTIDGGAGNDSLDGGAGDDAIEGGSGTDSILGGAGNDTIDGGGNTDTIYGGDGDDVIVDTGGVFSDDTIYGEAGNDTIAGGQREDYLDGGDDADTFVIEDGFGSDTIVGGEGVTTGTDFDTLDLSALTGPVTVTFTGDGAGTVTDGTDTLAFSEIEKIILTDQADVVDASADTSGIEIVGLGGDDTITAGSGDDTIDAGSGDDVIAGGAGDDSLTTGTGEDTIVLDDGAGADTVTDFDTGDADTDGLTDDQFDVSGMSADDGSAMRSSDVSTADDGAGNARLEFPASTSNSSMTMQSTPTSQMDEGSEYQAAGIPCFAAGTFIATPAGEVPVERLRPGDLVLTRDDGPRPLLWSAMRRLSPTELASAPELRPVQIAAGAFGNDRALVVSPQHGLLLALDGEEILVRAAHLARIRGGKARVKAGCRRVTYCHLLFERHEVVFSNGLPSESYFPGPRALLSLEAQAAAEFDALLPDLRFAGDREATCRLYGEPARRYSRRRMLPDHAGAFSDPH